VFFSRKLSVQQQKFSVTKIELLAIMEMLKEFKGRGSVGKIANVSNRSFDQVR
jgi:hypothetical protein